MKKELKVSYIASSQREVVDRLKAAPIWSYNSELSAWYTRNMPGTDLALCFEYSLENKEKVFVWLYPDEEKCWYVVSNITPVEKSDNTSRKIKTNYYELQDEICKKLVPTVPEASIHEIQEWVDTDSYRLLTSFSSLANKSTGINNELDFKRFVQFVKSCSVDDLFVPNDELEEELIKLGWDEESSSELVEKFADFLRVIEYSSPN